MGQAAKFTDEQKLQIALELISGQASHAEVCRKYEISASYAYKLKDRALEILRNGIGRPAGQQHTGHEEARRAASGGDVVGVDLHGIPADGVGGESDGVGFGDQIALTYPCHVDHGRVFTGARPQDHARVGRELAEQVGE